jgi:hypothetical protein
MPRLPSDDAAFWMLKAYMGILRPHCDDDCGLAIGNLIRDRRPRRTNVRYWHKADIEELPANVAFGGKAGIHRT